MTGELPYHNREIQEMFKAADDRADAFHDKLMEKLNGIERQTTATNGRVTTIERWQYSFMGGIGVLTFIVVPLLAWALWTLSNINETIHKSVDTALQAYDIQK